MKKFLKGFLCVAVAFVVIFNFTACKKPISNTTTDTSKTIYNGQNTNGGITLVHDGYLYFVNGTKENNGSSAKKNTRSAVCRVKIDEEGKIDNESYEVVVDNLVGYDNGSISIFGDFLYFVTPNDEVNYQDAKLNNQTKFMRYDLVNKASYELYTTKLNSSDESVSYAYYIVGEELMLVVFEKSNGTITSLKINKEVTTNYVIEGVTSCALSENYGTCVTENATVDANNFVFYTKSHESYTYPQEGNITYKTSPNVDNSVCISNDKKSVSLLCIRNGKLVYSSSSISGNEDIIYSQSITASQNEKLSFSEIISYKTHENVVFIENKDGSISLVCFDENTDKGMGRIVVFQANENNQDINGIVINTISVKKSSSNSSSESKSTVSFVGVVTLNEKVESEATTVEGETESDETEATTVEVTYLIYIESNAVYKIEIMRDGEISRFNNPVKLTKSTVSAPSGNLIPETIGNYLYIFAKEVGTDNKDTDKIYLFRVDLTIENDSKDYATLIGIKE